MKVTIWLLDSTGVFLVKGGEYLIESFYGELVSGAEASKGLLDELSGFLLIEGTALVDIIVAPDLVDDAMDSLFFGVGHCRYIFF